jgi:hypothetical protein
MTKEKVTSDSTTGPATFRQSASTAVCMGKKYHLFHEGSARVTYVVGEFYWRVEVGEKVKVKDFIAPPEILSCESSKTEVIWTVGEYITADEIKLSFKIDKILPVQTGIAPNQPSTLLPLVALFLKYWKIFISILFASQILLVASAKNDAAYFGEFTFSSRDPEKVKVTPQFELKHGRSNAQVNLRSPVLNDWLEIQAELVNDGTGATYEFEEGVEFYSGTDSDGAWSEGSQASNVILSSIPPGMYHLNIEASASAANSSLPGDPNRAAKYTVGVARDVVTWSNFLYAAVLISLLPLLIWSRSRSFEKSRWSTSDFSPYWSESSEEEDD